MLPDFPKQKAQFNTLLMAFLKDQTQARLAPFNQAPTHTHHEGSTWTLVREDGSEDTAEYTAISTVLQVHVDEVPHMTLVDILGKLDEAWT